MTPIEAMAKAYYEATKPGHHAGWETYSSVEGNLEWALNGMRAALIALRDCGVTEGMLDRWLDADITTSEEAQCETTWRAMLDAAMGE